tara:strand:+ start:569 stop:994 length:426 start_codon:yes stop_codon:yes gene_type:complete
MIRYDLVCSNNHKFESWFKDSKSFQEQVHSKDISCPICNDNIISKTLMAPGIPKKENTKKDDVLLNKKSNSINNAIKKIRNEIKENSEYVGKEFPEAARKIHYNEENSRSIYGEASLDDVKELKDEGIDVIHIPDAPDDKN